MKHLKFPNSPFLRGFARGNTIAYGVGIIIASVLTIIDTKYLLVLIPCLICCPCSYLIYRSLSKEIVRDDLE